MMSGATGDVDSFAKFLVEVFPEFAIELLGNADICNRAAFNHRVERACHALGPDHFHIKDLITKWSFDELKERKIRAYGHGPLGIPPPMTPMVGGHVGYQGHRAILPSTPSSIVSGRITNDWIIVIHGTEEYKLTSRYSGSDKFLIGVDKIQRFPGLNSNWSKASEKCVLGGQQIEVCRYVELTWTRLEARMTDWNTFWVVPSGYIKDADVLLGLKSSQSRGDRNEG